MTFLNFGGCLALMALLTGDSGQQIVATWLNTSGEGKIQIYGQNDRFFGKLVWLKYPLNEQGKPKVDHKNPDDNLKSRPLIGLVILKDFEYEGDKKWDDGEIYDPKSGKTYSCTMTLASEDVLEVRGYIGISLIGRTERWTRVK